MGTGDGDACATELRPFVFDVSKIDGRSNVELMGDTPESQPLLELLGRDLITRVLVQTPTLCVYQRPPSPESRSSRTATACSRSTTSCAASCGSATGV